jgi:hypothetical protein
MGHAIVARLVPVLIRTRLAEVAQTESSYTFSFEPEVGQPETDCAITSVRSVYEGQEKAGVRYRIRLSRWDGNENRCGRIQKSTSGIETSSL